MVRVVYENIPQGIMTDCETDITDPKSFVDFNDFQVIRQVNQYATLEHNFWKLNGEFENFPDTPTGLGYISSVISDENGEFTNDIVITRTYGQNYTTPRNNNRI